MQPQIITAKSWNNTEYYYNWAANDFMPFEQADLDSPDYHCSEANMENALQTAEASQLASVKLEFYY